MQFVYDLCHNELARFNHRLLFSASMVQFVYHLCDISFCRTCCWISYSRWQFVQLFVFERITDFFCFLLSLVLVFGVASQHRARWITKGCFHGIWVHGVRFDRHPGNARNQVDTRSCQILVATAPQWLPLHAYQQSHSSRSQSIQSSNQPKGRTQDCRLGFGTKLEQRDETTNEQGHHLVVSPTRTPVGLRGIYDQNWHVECWLYNCRNVPPLGLSERIDWGNSTRPYLPHLRTSHRGKLAGNSKAMCLVVKV